MIVKYGKGLWRIANDYFDVVKMEKFSKLDWKYFSVHDREFIFWVILIIWPYKPGSQFTLFTYIHDHVNLIHG